MESLSIFTTKSLVVTPLENKFSAYLNPSIFPDPNGEVVQLEATCQINWDAYTAPTKTKGSTWGYHCTGIRFR
ncbi:hypothetical protein Pelo_17177 [Pelomyxa schiedti]|nr:hypothetical protein Pelo_17177 [Pelomyxa schiedti]